MGGEDIDSGPNMSDPESGSGKLLLRHEDVSDAIISKLLKDFTSAELFPQSGDVNGTKASAAKDDRAWAEVIESLKHLHVKRPGFKKHRRAKKYSQARRGSPNLLNLAIAAGNLQKPILWPARLNCDCKKSSTTLLNPSKLKVYGSKSTYSFRDVPSLQDKKPLLGETCCLCKDQYSNKEHLGSKHQFPDVVFGHRSHVSNLSFNSLCHEQSSSKTSSDGETVSPKQEGAFACGPTSLRVRPSNDRQQHHTFSGQQLFTNNPLNQLPPSDLLCSSGSPTHHLPRATNMCTPAIYAKPSTTTSSATAVPVASCASSSSSHRPLQHPASATSGQMTSSLTSMGRSCSQAVRDMEDTNVNELASYLEDLLHIPKKMSTMAEMMYA
ncbi:hypothetical protein EGW08_006331 [Elysia chlorotica]|uniref:Oxidative stress-responsive serine-rich protein 1 n=1 Tax=Elysia chlorotica TaxID=188477 RepID=A0A433TWS8_ELYCH|nr:hypothetical protein EGW08_006331 [Elysia chlorotica]